MATCAGCGAIVDRSQLVPIRGAGRCPACAVAAARAHLVLSNVERVRRAELAQRHGTVGGPARRGARGAP